MMHFETMDRMLTGQRDATVDQCYRCHTIDHRNNIKDVGFYKHHWATTSVVEGTSVA